MKERYRKYFERPLQAADPKVMESIENGPCNPDLTLNPKDINLLFNPGYLPIETGWCHMPDGTAFIAVRTVMENVTLDMLRWWFAWHPIDDERYQLWYPPCHYGASVGKEDLVDLLNPNLDYTDKIYDRIHSVKEDIYGRGEAPAFNIHFRNPVDMGFDQDKVNQKEKFSVICAFPTLGKDVPNSGFVSSMLHFARKTDNGIELRSRFFQGYTFINRKPVAIASVANPVPAKAPYTLAKHCAEEYANLASILPELYNEEKDNWD